MHLKAGICIPTLNAGSDWAIWLKEFSQQNYYLDTALVIDSSSQDNTVALAKEAGLTVYTIDRANFNHGGTRQLGVTQMSSVDIVIFLTQDAILATPDSINNLLSAFNNPEVGAAYGRQLPRKNASDIEAHSRLHNYPDQSRINSLEDSQKLGIKTAFISNSFAAYRRKSLEEIGGFPTNTIMNEDTFVAAKMLLNGWKVAYCADAKVYHSHDYSNREEFRRYFDIGVFHAKEPWVRNKLGQAEKEGMKYVSSEIKYLFKKNPIQIPSALLRTVLKLAGYRLGLIEQRIPMRLKFHLSMHKGYWACNK